MKKSTMILSALLLGGAAFTANAQSRCFITGPFNDFDGWNNETWELTEDPDVTDLFRGTFEIPAGQFEVRFSASVGEIVPGDGGFTPSGQNDDFTFDNGFYSSPCAVDFNMAFNNFWIDSAWEGGKVEFTVDLTQEDQYNVVFSVNDETDNIPVGSGVYISGSFNDFDPQENDETWELSVVEDSEMLRGTFNIPASDKVAFRFVNLLRSGFQYVPAVLVDEENTENTTQNLVVEFDNNWFQGYFGLDMNLAPTGPFNWVIDNWEGGNLEVTLDPIAMTIVLSVVDGSDEPIIGGPVYIAGMFNDYTPGDDEIWQLNVTDDPETFRGTFDIPEGEFSFYLINKGNLVVPGELDANGYYSPSDENAEVAFDEYGFYAGNWADETPMNPSPVMWTNTTWAGGQVEVTVDFRDNSILLSVLSEEQPGVEPSPYYLSGSFNDNNPAGLEVWNFGMTDKEGMYKGTFSLEAGEVSFQIVSMKGQVIVPGELDPNNEISPAVESVEVELEDGFYAGELAVTSLSPVNWVITNWEGGDLEIIIDLDEGSIVLSTVQPEPGVEPSPYYLSGNFNDNNPAGLEIWNFGMTDKEGMYKGTFSLEAGEVSFQIVSMKGQVIVPGELDPNNEISPAVESVEVELEDGFYAGELAVTSLSPVNWVITNWVGGDLEIIIDLDEGSIVLSADASEEPIIGGPVYIAGMFNNYTPGEDEIWQLNVTDDPETFRGTFDIPEGEFSFYLINKGNLVVPGELDANGYYSPSEENVEVAFDEYGFYAGNWADETQMNPSPVMWTNTTWAGGQVEVTVDFRDNSFILSVPAEETVVGGPFYIAANFNGFDPQGLETWELTPTEAEGVFRAEFPVYTEELSFYIVGKANYFVPGVLDANGYYSPAEENVVVLDDDDFFSDYYAEESMLNQNPVMWVNNAWVEGTVLQVTLDTNTGEIILSSASDPLDEEDVFYIAGEFNDYITDNNWVIYPVEGENGVYSGTFDIPEGQLSFYLEYYGMTVVPGDEYGDPIEGGVEIGEGNYTGMIAPYGFANQEYTWRNIGWLGGNVTITIDINESTITISQATSAVKSIGSELNGDEAIYNLQGVKVSKDHLTKGIYIINGKKVLVK